MNNANVIAKFGGSSVADPLRVMQQLVNEEQPPDIVVVSAPGRSESRSQKVTDMLISLSQTGQGFVAVQERMAEVAEVMHPDGIPQRSQVVLEHMEADVRHWRRRGWAIPTLGERWSGKLFATFLEREYVDASEVIRFDTEGALDVVASKELAVARFEPGARYVVPGFYGADQRGAIHQMPRGGSDITPAIIGTALEYDEYHNWSDVDGFMDADPRHNPDAEMYSALTLDEVQVLAANGCELLHPAVCDIVARSALQIVMRNTFGPLGNRGTTITPQTLMLY